LQNCRWDIHDYEDAHGASVRELLERDRIREPTQLGLAAAWARGRNGVDGIQEMGHDMGRPAHVVTTSSLLHFVHSERGEIQAWESATAQDADNARTGKLPNPRSRSPPNRDRGPSMQAQAYRITENRRLESVPPERVSGDWKAGDASYWLDLQGSSKDAFEHYLGDLEVNEAIVQLVEDAGNALQVIPTENAIFFDLPVHAGADDESTGHLTVLCLPRLLITRHEQPIGSLETLATFIQRTSLLSASTTSALVCLILILLSTMSSTVAQRVSSRVNRLDAQMDRDSGAIKLEQILAEKARVRALEMVAEESNPVYRILNVTNTEALNLTELKSFFQVVLGNTKFLTHNVYRLSSQLGDLHQRYSVHVQEKSDQRLSVLTIISAIFLPLTLLAGIYGMNFQDMPELHLRYAYPALLGIMVVIAIGMWRYFKRRSWLD
jgi:magnesium transporter